MFSQWLFKMSICYLMYGICIYIFFVGFYGIISREKEYTVSLSPDSTLIVSKDPDSFSGVKFSSGNNKTHVYFIDDTDIPSYTVTNYVRDTVDVYNKVYLFSVYLEENSTVYYYIDKQDIELHFYPALEGVGFTLRSPKSQNYQFYFFSYSPEVVKYQFNFNRIRYNTTDLGDPCYTDCKSNSSILLLETLNGDIREQYHSYITFSLSKDNMKRIHIWFSIVYMMPLMFIIPYLFLRSCM